MAGPSSIHDESFLFTILTRTPDFLSHIITSPPPFKEEQSREAIARGMSLCERRPREKKPPSNFACPRPTPPPPASRMRRHPLTVDLCTPDRGCRGNISFHATWNATFEVLTDGGGVASYSPRNTPCGRYGTIHTSNRQTLCPEASRMRVAGGQCA
jgi:hypothetical protein